MGRRAAARQPHPGLVSWSPLQHKTLGSLAKNQQLIFYIIWREKSIIALCFPMAIIPIRAHFYLLTGVYLD